MLSRPGIFLYCRELLLLKYLFWKNTVTVQQLGAATKWHLTRKVSERQVEILTLVKHFLLVIYSELCIFQDECSFEKENTLWSACFRITGKISECLNVLAVKLSSVHLYFPEKKMKKNILIEKIVLEEKCYITKTKTNKQTTATKKKKWCCCGASFYFFHNCYLRL